MPALPDILWIAATLGSAKPLSVETPRPYEALSYRGSLHRYMRVVMARMELSGRQGPLKGVGFQPLVDLAYLTAGAALLPITSGMSHKGLHSCVSRSHTVQ